MSYKVGDEVHIEDDEASGGTKTGHVRWILGISLLAVILLMSAIWIFGAATQGDVEEEVTKSGRLEDTVVEATEEDTAGGIVTGESFEDIEQ